MRCDCCPLCPIAEDDVCGITESKYAILHKDGMLGCKHPYNWCRKRADDYDEYLGRMADDFAKRMLKNE